MHDLPAFRGTVVLVRVHIYFQFQGYSRGEGFQTLAAWLGTGSRIPGNTLIKGKKSGETFTIESKRLLDVLTLTLTLTLNADER